MNKKFVLRDCYSISKSIATARVRKRPSKLGGASLADNIQYTIIQQCSMSYRVHNKIHSIYTVYTVQYIHSSTTFCTHNYCTTTDCCGVQRVLWYDRGHFLRGTACAQAHTTVVFYYREYSSFVHTVPRKKWPYTPFFCRRRQKVFQQQEKQKTKS